jgi:hypothetical protein
MNNKIMMCTLLRHTQPRAGRDRTSGSSQRHASRRVATYAPDRHGRVAPEQIHPNNARSRPALA